MTPVNQNNKKTLQLAKEIKGCFNKLFFMCDFEAFIKHSYIKKKTDKIDFIFQCQANNKAQILTLGFAVRGTILKVNKGLFAPGRGGFLREKGARAVNDGKKNTTRPKLNADSTTKMAAHVRYRSQLCIS